MDPVYLCCPRNTQENDEEKRIESTKANQLNNMDKSGVCRKENANISLTSSDREANRPRNEEKWTNSPLDFKKGILKTENKKKDVILDEISSLKEHENDEDYAMIKKKFHRKKRSKSRKNKLKKGRKDRQKSNSPSQGQEKFKEHPQNMGFDIQTNFNIFLTNNSDSNHEICREIADFTNGTKATFINIKPKEKVDTNSKEDDDKNLEKFTAKDGKLDIPKNIKCIENAEQDENEQCKTNGPPPAYSHQSHRPSINQLASKGMEKLKEDVIYVGCDQTTPITLPCGKIYLLDTRKSVSTDAKSMTESEKTEGQKPLSNEGNSNHAETRAFIALTEGNMTSNKGQCLQTVSLEELDKFKSNRNKIEEKDHNIKSKQNENNAKTVEDIYQRKSLPVPELEKNKQLRSYSMPTQYKIADTSHQQQIINGKNSKLIIKH